MKSSTKQTKASRKTETAQASEQPRKFVWWHWLLAVAAVLFVAFEVYSPALNGEFLFDDSYLPFLMPNVAEGPLRGWLGVRPLLMLTYWLNYKVWGLTPFPYHAVSVIFHAVNSVLVGLIVRRLLSWAGETGWTREALSVFAGALFLLHPVQTESVAYVSSRSETMSVLFFLAALAVFVCRDAITLGAGRIIAIILLFGAACGVKEHTAVLPALLLLIDYYFITPFQATAIRSNLKLYVPIAVAGVLGLVAVVSVLQRAETAGFRVKEFTWYEYLFTQFRVIWLYLRLYIAPFGQNADYEIPISHSILDLGSLLGLIGLAALAVIAWRYRRVYPLASFGYFGFLLLLAPTSSFVPIRDVAVERRLYLPFICLLLITVDFLRRWKTSRLAMAGVLGTVCVVAGSLTYQRSAVWSSALALWEDTSAKSPGNARAKFQLAYAQWQNGQCAPAALTYEQVSRMQKPDERLWIDWAYALECAGKPDEAVAKLREAIKTQPSAHSYAVIGMIYGKQGRADEALEALNSAEQADPNFDMTYVYRGNILAGRGQMAEAASQYRRALSINANNLAAQQGLVLAQTPR